MRRFVLRNRDVYDRLCEEVLALMDHIGGEELIEVVIRPHRKDRSLEQNDRLRAIHRVAATYLGEDPELIHILACRRFLGARIVEHEGHVYSLPNTTTHFYDVDLGKYRKLNVKEMGEFMMVVERDYAERGVPVDLVIGDGREEKETTKSAGDE
jgi:hypothetical protein